MEHQRQRPCGPAIGSAPATWTLEDRYGCQSTAWATERGKQSSVFVCTQAWVVWLYVFLFEPNAALRLNKILLQMIRDCCWLQLIRTPPGKSKLPCSPSPCKEVPEEDLGYEDDFEVCVTWMCLHALLSLVWEICAVAYKDRLLKVIFSRAVLVSHELLVWRRGWGDGALVCNCNRLNAK